MNRLSAIDAFGPAFARVRAMLFRPFRLGTWLKMGLIGLLGGGMSDVDAAHLGVGDMRKVSTTGPAEPGRATHILTVVCIGKIKTQPRAAVLHKRGYP
jgi:hypothetical protein